MALLITMALQIQMAVVSLYAESPSAANHAPRIHRFSGHAHAAADHTEEHSSSERIWADLTTKQAASTREHLSPDGGLHKEPPAWHSRQVDFDLFQSIYAAFSTTLRNLYPYIRF